MGLFVLFLDLSHKFRCEVLKNACFRFFNTAFHMIVALDSWKCLERDKIVLAYEIMKYRGMKSIGTMDEGGSFDMV